MDPKNLECEKAEIKTMAISIVVKTLKSTSSWNLMHNFVTVLDIKRIFRIPRYDQYEALFKRL